jgi:tol-pal system protein YbgF
MNKYVKIIFIVSIAFAADVKGVYSQGINLDKISDQLNRLERDIQVLSRRVYKGELPSNISSGRRGSLLVTPQGGVGSANIIRLEDRLAEFKGELQNSTNRIESISHDVDEIKVRLDKLVSDIDFRLTRLESAASEGGGGGMAAKEQNLSSAPRASGVKNIGPPTDGPVVFSGKPGILGEISEANLSKVKRQENLGVQNGVPSNSSFFDNERQQKSILPKGTPKIQYLYALSMLRKTQYNNAELAFSEFIQRHPKNEFTPNARYWLGESFYVRKNYRSAAEAFLRGYQQAPKGVKAPGSLLKLGMSLANLKKKQDACATFSKLAKDYPDISGNIKKHLDREFKRSSCK